MVSGRALTDLLFGTVDGGTRLVEDVHLAIAARSFRSAGTVPFGRAPVKFVRTAHHGIASGVYATLRGVSAVLRTVTGGVLDLAGVRVPASPTGDVALGALNGVVGDTLDGRAPELSLPMEVRRRGRTVPIDRATLASVYPEATARIAVFVHGLCGTEHAWRLFSERHYGNRRTTYGSRLACDLGYTPVELRYNTGLHVSENGRRLADLLERLVDSWPVDVREIALIGHSMGGLVSRSACHYGREAGHCWPDRVRHVVCLGSPHLGAPLEKIANVGASLLGAFGETRPFAHLLNGRSVGIKDLRFGYVVDEEWQDHDVDALLEDHARDVPFLEGATYYFVAATITRRPHHPLGEVLGDVLVRVPSASGRSRSGRRIPFRIGKGRHFGSVNHLELLNHPAVYEQIRRWLAGPSVLPAS